MSTLPRPRRAAQLQAKATPVKRRPALAPALAICAGLAVAAGFVAPPATAWAQGMMTGTQGTFTVPGVTVEATASDAGLARDQAIAKAQRAAWTKLMGELLPPGSAVPTISDENLTRAVQSFSVDDERMSPGSYAATLTVKFWSEPVRAAMTAAGATDIIEPPGRPFVVLPVTMEPDGRTELWDNRTEWREAWEERDPASKSLVPLTVPFGDPSDIAATSAEEAANGDQNAMAKMAQLHGADGVAVVTTSLPPADGAPQPMRVEVSVHGADGQQGRKTVTVRVDPDDRRADVIARAVVFSSATIDDLWRQRHTVSAGPQQSLTATLPLNSLRDWIDARARLGQVGGGARVDLMALRRDGARLQIGYRGDVSELTQRMAERGLTLSRNGDAWIVTAVAAPPPAVTAQPGPVPGAPQ